MPKRIVEKTIDCWVGLSGGRVLIASDMSYYEGVRRGEFFLTRKAARRCYQDVRRAKLVIAETEAMTRKRATSR